MADLRRLDGTPLPVEEVGKNKRIDEFLANLAARNDEGRIAAIITVYLTPEGYHCVKYELPDHDKGYPWGLALRGALVAAQYVIDHDVVEITAPPGPEKPEPAA